MDDGTFVNVRSLSGQFPHSHARRCYTPPMRVSFRSLESLVEKRIWQGKSVSRLASPGGGSFLSVIQVGNLSPSGILPDIEEVEVSDHPGEDAFVRVGYVLLGQATSNLTAVAIEEEFFEGHVVGPNIAILAVNDEIL